MTVNGYSHMQKRSSEMKDKIMIAMNVKKIEMEHLDDNDKIGFGYIIMCNCNGQELNWKTFQENDLKKAVIKSIIVMILMLNIRMKITFFDIKIY